MRIAARHKVDMIGEQSAFLNDPRNKDIRSFIEHHVRVEKGRLMRLEVWQKRILDALYPEDGSNPYQQVLLGLPRKSGKSTFLGAIQMWELLFSPCEDPECYSVSRDQDQSRIVLNSSKKIVRRSPEIREVVVVMKNAIECPFRNGVYVALSADLDSSYGLNPSFCCVDEFATSDWELFTSLITGQGARAAREEPVKAFCIGTAGYDLGSEFFKWYDRCNRGKMEEDVYFFWTNEMLSSFNQTPAYKRFLTRQRNTLRPEQYQRFHENKWIEGAGAFVSREDIERCIDPGVSPQGKGRAGVRYVLGLDLGLSHDRSVSTIVHQAGDQIILDRIRVWEGSQQDEVMLNNVEEDILWCDQVFGLEAVMADPWQGKLLFQRLRERGVPCHEVKFTGANLDELVNNLYQLIHTAGLRIWRDQPLIDELLTVQVTEKSYGLRLDHRSNQFSDRVISLGLACLGASQEVEERGLTMEELQDSICIGGDFRSSYRRW